MIPGMSPGFFMGAGGLTEVFFVDSAQAFNAQVVAPADIRAGDFLLCFDNYGRDSTGGTLPPNVLPAGFTDISSITGTLFHHRISGKIANGTEGGTTITGGAWAAVRKLMQLVVIRGNVRIKGFAGHPTPALNISGPAGTYATSIQSGGGEAPLLVYVMCVLPSQQVSGTSINIDQPSVFNSTVGPTPQPIEVSMRTRGAILNGPPVNVSATIVKGAFNFTTARGGYIEFS